MRSKQYLGPAMSGVKEAARGARGSEGGGRAPAPDESSGLVCTRGLFHHFTLKKLRSSSLVAWWLRIHTQMQEMGSYPKDSRAAEASKPMRRNYLLTHSPRVHKPQLLKPVHRARGLQQESVAVRSLCAT